MELERHYTLPEEEARARLRAMTDYWVKRYGIDVRWGEREVQLHGKVMGVSFEGVVEVGGGRIFARMKAGFLAEKLGGRAYVNRKLDEYLDPASSIESLRAKIPS